MTAIPGARERSIISSVVFTIGAQAGDVINVGIQLNGDQGAALGEASTLIAYLSDNATGLDLNGTAPSGGVAIGTDGAVLVALTAGKAFILQSEADGDIDLNITEAGADTWYLVLVLPNGEHAVSGAITFA